MLQRDSTQKRLERIEKRLEKLQIDQSAFSEWEKTTESLVERKVYEIKAISYITLVIASVLLALVLGMVLNALGVRIG
ncbi:hypothetical protein HY572_04780 [Candidatus Micrarchaeota archaeon]|nr:hypothetical protein [Candidatus Micrarchaeota archaeon]